MQRFADYQPPATLLQQHRILITGASSGLGRSAALSYAAHGAEVALLGRRSDELNKTAQQIIAAGGAEPLVYPLDLLTDNGDKYRQLGLELSHRWGALDGILHSAGMLGVPAPIASTDVIDWYKVIQVNLNAAFLLTRELLPLTEAAPAASIIFTSSGVARRPKAYWGAYSVSKRALEGFVEVLADELEGIGNIRVNGIDPGVVNTPMRRTAMPGEDPAVNPEPETVMGAYLFLMGADSREYNGRILHAQQD